MKEINISEKGRPDPVVESIKAIWSNTIPLFLICIPVALILKGLALPIALILFGCMFLSTAWIWFFQKRSLVRLDGTGVNYVELLEQVEKLQQKVDELENAKQNLAPGIANEFSQRLKALEEVSGNLDEKNMGTLQKRLEVLEELAVSSDPTEVPPVFRTTDEKNKTRGIKKIFD
ncbi:hypothetical protein ACFL35_02535 [Candidatus Riflebacteria bacterium]